MFLIITKQRINILRNKSNLISLKKTNTAKAKAASFPEGSIKP